MKNILIKISFSILTFLLMFSCSEKDDYTGDSVLSVSSPTLAVSLGFPNAQTLIEQEISYDFTVTISEIQAVDVVVYLEQTEGTATVNEDFSMPQSVKIERGALSASGKITIHEDEIMEDTETVTIQIGAGNEANLSGVSGQTVSFEIANLTEGDLVVGMSWAASSSVTDNYGNEIAAYDLANLRLLLADFPFTRIYDKANGTANETYILSEAAPDMTYSFIADVHAAMSEIPVDLDITLTFDQVGVINGQMHSFSTALNTTESCPTVNYVMATVTKSGNSYSIAEVGKKNSIDLNDVVGTWSGQASWFDIFGYTSEVITSMDVNGDLLINGLAFQWFKGWWDEVIISNTPVKITFNDGCTDDFIIEEQPYIVSTWNGSPQPAYNLSGSGTLVKTATGFRMIVFPILHQSSSMIDGNNWGVQFVEVLTLD